MIGEIIAIGDELTSGRILNTTSGFAARQLFAAGHIIIAMTTIGDDPALIGETLKRALGRAEFVIVTGGLGATSDDLTNKAAASALNRPATFYPEILRRIESKRNKKTPMGRNTLEKLAWLPNGSTVLNPDGGMAGHLLIHDKKPIFFLPGVPHEMEEMLVNLAIPRLTVWKDGTRRRVRQKIYKIFGLPETEINRQLEHLEHKDQRIRIGYYPVFPEVHLSLTCFSNNSDEVERLFADRAVEIESIFAEYIYGADADTLESEVGRLLTEQQKSLAIAESCTGGMVAHRITRIPGSSAYFLGGVVSYSNDLKELFLGVDDKTLKEYGAVSSATVRAMAEGLRQRTGASLAVSVSGIAGPGGGSKEKPVGTVFFGLATAAGISDMQAVFPGDRRQIQEIACLNALNLIRRVLLNKPLRLMDGQDRLI